MAYSGEGSLIEGQVEGDPNKTVVPVAVDSNGHLIIDLEASSITIGSVDLNDGVGNPIFSTAGALEVNVVNTPIPVIINNASTAVVTSVNVTTTPTILLSANTSRKGLAVQTTDQTTFVKFDTTVSNSLYSYELSRKSILEKDNYTGPVTAVTTSGSTNVLVTELI